MSRNAQSNFDQSFRYVSCKESQWVIANCGKGDERGDLLFTDMCIYLSFAFACGFRAFVLERGTGGEKNQTADDLP